MKMGEQKDIEQNSFIYVFTYLLKAYSPVNRTGHGTESKTLTERVLFSQVSKHAPISDQR